MSATESAAAEAAGYRKVYWRILPLLIVCYLFAYLDRVNVGFAQLQMSADIGLSNTAYGVGAGVFFIGYFLFEVPSNLILRKVGARVWIARIMVTWGVVSATFAFVQSETWFYVLRFLLGLAEAGFFPGIIYYLSCWAPAPRRARIVAIFMAAIPVSSIIGNPLSGWIMQSMDATAGWAGWRWMFLVEGLPSILLGVLVFFWLDDSIKSAKWLNDDEKAMLSGHLDAEERAKLTSPATLTALVADPRVWLLCAVYFAFALGVYGLSFFMPIMVKEAGVTGPLNIGLVTAIPYVCALVAMLVLSRSADRMRERRWHVIVPALVAAAGFLAVSMTPGSVAQIACLSIAAAGVLSCAPLFWSLPTAFLTGAAAAAGIAWINSVGNLAGFLAPTMLGYLRDATGNGNIGMWVFAGALVVAAGLVFLIPAKSLVADRVEA